MHRLTGFLLWGGLALLFLGVISCGAGCVFIAGAVEFAGEDQEVIVFSFSGIAFALGIGMLALGALFKAFGSLVRGRKD